MKKSLLLLCLPLTVFAAVEVDLSGNLEAQGRHSWNNPEARRDLGQAWRQSDFSLLYGNLNGKVEMDGSRFEANVFARYTDSALYRSGYLAPQIYTFPQKLVARDVFKMNHRDESQSGVSESVINKLYYQWDSDGNRFMVGRMYINYGLGEIFNPINPFNQPTGLTTISQVAQGNDGFNFTFFKDDHHTMEFYLIGDKRINDYDGTIDRTAWLHGEYQATDKLQLDYVIGDDQKRHKAGGQASYQFEKSLVYGQLLYQSEFTDRKPSHNLWDVAFGYDEQLTNKWHLRTEAGYQKRNRYSGLGTISDRFLPTEYFVAVANQYDIHPLVKVSGTIITDVKSGFTYFITRNTYNITKNTEAEIFGFIPVAKGDRAENPAQKLVTTDVGLAVRAFF